MSKDTALLRRLSAAVPADMADAVQAAAAARGLTVADYLRGSVQGRLLMDGAAFNLVPNLYRVAAPASRTVISC